MKTEKKWGKQAALVHWIELEPNQPILPHMVPIPYKATGSRYGACGIRIDGSPEFIDAILSRIKDVIHGENNTTRLELARTIVQPVQDIGGKTKVFDNAEPDGEVCYIRLHARGGDAQAINTAYDVYGERKKAGK